VVLRKGRTLRSCKVRTGGIAQRAVVGSRKVLADAIAQSADAAIIRADGWDRATC